MLWANVRDIKKRKTELIEIIIKTKEDKNEDVTEKNINHVLDQVDLNGIWLFAVTWASLFGLLGNSEITTIGTIFGFIVLMLNKVTIWKLTYSP